MPKAQLIRYAVTILCFVKSPTLAACDLAIPFSIEPQAADKALLRFAQQAGVSVLFPGGAFSEVDANALQGTYCAEEGLRLLLDGVNIEASLDDGLLVISNAHTPGQSPDELRADLRKAQQQAAANSSPEAEPGLFKKIFSALFTARNSEDSTASSSVTVEEIIVTGSLVRQTMGMNAPTPVTSVSYPELTQFNAGSTVAEQLDTLPQFFSTQTAQRGGVTFIDAGGSYLNLRGMGTNRTLVLLNGSRVIPSDSFGNVNVDNLPSALLKRVDIVTGGASAAYGADAISGVVNFVLDQDFEGTKGIVSTGISERGDGKNWHLAWSGGGQFGDRLHILSSIEARQIDQITPDPDRLDNWLDWGHVQNPLWDPAAPAGQQPQRLTVSQVFPTTASPQGLITTPGFKYQNFTFTDDGLAVRPYQFGAYTSPLGESATRSQAGGPEYATWRQAVNGGPDSNEVVQRSLFLNLKYELTDNFDLFAQTIVARTESNNDGRRGNPALDSIWAATIYIDNPFLPLEVRDAMQLQGLDAITVAKRGSVIGPQYSNYYANRSDRNLNQIESLTTGFNATLFNGWTLNGRYQHGNSTLTTSARNILRLDNFFMGLDAIANPRTGAPVCHVSLTNPDPAALKAAVAGKLLPSPLSLLGVAVDSPIGPMNFAECVPINVFGLGNVSAQARDWVEAEAKKNHRNLNQEYIELLLSGELHQGFGAGPLSFATGLSYRAESFSQQSFPAYGERGLSNAPELGIRGIPGGFTGPGNRSLHQFSAIGTGTGTFHVSEWFGELNLPLLEFATGQRLGANLALRSSDYTSHGPIQSWKLGFDLQLTETLRWRLTRSRDVREPNFSEQFVAGSGGANLNDPAFHETYVITSIGGPNPNLASEKAYTLTTGFVYNPTFAPWIQGLQISADWYDIELSSAISRLGPQRLTDDCFLSAVPEICQLVQRNPDTNRVDRVIDRYFNIGGARTTGMDLEVHYTLQPDLLTNLYETFTLRAFVGYLQENSSTTASGIKVDSVKSRERPQYTVNISALYNAGPYGLRVQQRYYDSTLFNPGWVEGVDVDDNSIASQSITNLTLSYDNSWAGKDWRADFSITNLLDREPPVIPGQVISNSHDQYGRRYQLALIMDF